MEKFNIWSKICVWISQASIWVLSMFSYVVLKNSFNLLITCFSFKYLKKERKKRGKGKQEKRKRGREGRKNQKAKRKKEEKKTHTPRNKKDKNQNKTTKSDEINSVL